MDLDRLKKGVKLKAARFCAYQERTHQQVREKLRTLLEEEDLIEEIIAELIAENFINEERYAKSFASGKFRLKKWGRNKILLNLKQHGLTQYCIKKGLEEIPEEDYLEQLEKLTQDKFNSLSVDNIFERKHKVSIFLINKGYEPDLVWSVLDRISPR